MTLTNGGSLSADPCAQTVAFIGRLQRLLAISCVAACAALPAEAAQPYTWKNVQIVGGGFISGIVFNEGAPNIIYTRTDIGGMYRWNQANRTWIPLLDWVGWDNWGYSGV